VNFRALLGLMVLVTGCSSVPKYMREVDGERPLKAPPDKALVVFVRSARLGALVRAHVMDDQTNFLGTAISGGHFAVARQPGPQRFVVWSEVADILVADLAPGLVYFVEVVPRMGLMRARFNFKAAHQGTDLFPYPKADLDGTTRYTVDLEAARREMDDVEERREKLKEAVQELSGMSREALAEHTLSPNDGHLEAGQPHQGPIAMPAPAVVPAGTSPVRAAEAAAPAAPGQTRFGKGAVVRLKLKTGVQWLGEVVTETGQGLLLTVDGNTQMFKFADIETVDVLTPAK
jgi:hypothetical protein